MNARLCSGPSRASGHCFGRKLDVSSSTQTKFCIFTEDSDQGMLRSSKGLSLSQWDSPYANRIAASLTSSLKTRGSSTMAGEPSAVETDGGTQVGVSGGGKVEVEKIENQTAKYRVMIFAKSKKQSQSPRDRPS